MFKNNKYTHWYYSIIESAKQRAKINSEYYEEHHIVPECLGGEKTPDNLVSLTAREHFVVHMLLTKMTDAYKVKLAFVMMSLENPCQERTYRINSHTYNYLKKQNSIACSERNRNRIYISGYKIYHDPTTEKEYRINEDIDDVSNLVKGNSPKNKKALKGKNKGKQYYYNPETFESRAFNDNSEVPVGWVKGNINNRHKNLQEQFRNKMYYHNPLTGEEGRFSDCPDGWVKGRSKRFITNGVETKQINYILDSIPSGWRIGRTMNWKRNQRKKLYDS